MKHLLTALVYTGLALLANPGRADPADLATISALRDGDMKKLVLHESAKPAVPLAVTDTADAPLTLEVDGETWRVVNFWATWCAPCRKEMPTLSALQETMSDSPVEVVTIATGRNPPAAIDRFFEEEDISNLARHRDPKQKLARAYGVMGLPVTVILNPQGEEVGRLIGDADWHSESTLAILQALSTGG
ncbi:TlpA disulfide reductase family protein [Tropicimonas sp. TH_r6]|uniref:TlpA family protein disulfide reductase n=1 Tax=Tropicimonas sp. TH_r6 TaxID=3082085 RepID=UPI0029552795|nr:TlpA disulfide reductase family protein [Tropicimonas sp. TH_r6]MDV7144789.1 TlpA disulfide reductase family protein [Tropicimonas sp. TH_r6]